MFYKKNGLPEEGEFLLCTVTNIQYSSVFVHIDVYRTSGMIHISEIAAGRIRNIRDYVKEGKKVVCKVLRIHKQKGHVDLSLRRVSESQRRQTVNEMKLEQKAESIIKYVAKQKDIPEKKLYDKIAPDLLKDYEYVHHAFEDYVEGQIPLDLPIEKDMQEQIHELVKQRFKPKTVQISGELELSTYEGNGLEIVKEALKKAQDDLVEIRYLGGGKYKVSVEAKDYKQAEPILKEAVDKAVAYVREHNGKGDFKRKE